MARKNPDQRQLKAILIQKNIYKLDDDTYVVRSQSGKANYIVSRQGLEWSCQCPDHKIRGVVCKHIHAVVLTQTLKIRQNIEDSHQIEVDEEWFTPEISCPNCDSLEIVKRGKRKTKNGFVQRFGCKNCGKRFVVDSGFERMKATPQIVTVSLDLFFKGVSTRKIADHILQFYRIQVSHVAILKCIKKYSQLIKAYVREFQPKTSGIWHTDEMTLNIDGQMKWLWNCMDHNTRFLLASQISTKREIADAQRVFATAKAVSGEEKPVYVITDGLQSYTKAFKKEFYTMKAPRVQHIRKPRFTDRSNNNLVERLNGTIRDRSKTLRRLDNEKTAFVDGFQNYYNFLRPHMSLKGKTPAEAAGIDLKLEGNRWKSLIK